VRSPPACSRQRLPMETPHVGQGTDNCLAVSSFFRIWKRMQQDVRKSCSIWNTISLNFLVLISANCSTFHVKMFFWHQMTIRASQRPREIATHANLQFMSFSPGEAWKVLPNIMQHRTAPCYKITCLPLSCYRVKLVRDTSQIIFIRPETFGSLLASSNQMR